LFALLPHDRWLAFWARDLSFQAVLLRFMVCKEYATLIIGLLKVRAKVTWMTESWYSLEVKRSAADNF
jgi:hypothetical protein